MVSLELKNRETITIGGGIDTSLISDIIIIEH